MIILEDSRQQARKHDNVHIDFDKWGVSYERCKLYVGDYTIANHGDIAVDTKQSVLELAKDVYQDHERFRRELLRAQFAGIKLYVLVEEVLPDGKLVNWIPPAKSKVKPDALRKTLVTMHNQYNADFLFCAPRMTAKKILELLKYEGG